MLLWNIPLLLLALSWLQTPVFAVKKHDWKTCSQAGFCRRNRALADRASEHKASWTSPYSIQGTPSFSQGVYQATLENALFPDVSFSLELRIQEDSTVRVLVDEVNGLKQRYNEAASWALLQEPRVEVNDQAFQTDINARSSSITYGNGSNRVSIQHSPILVTFYRDDQTHVVLNERGLFNMEHFRKKTIEAPKESDKPDEILSDSQPDSQTVLQDTKDDKFALFLDKSEDGLWEETFGGRKDTKPKGPESLSLDITFPGYEHVFGIPQHTGPLSLKTTRGGEGAFDDPYRLWNADVFEYETDSPMSIYGSIPYAMINSMQAHRAGSTVGVFWLNAAETWIDIEKSSTPKPISDSWRKTRSKTLSDTGPTDKTTTTHWMSETGILDLFVFLGPDQDSLYKQFSSLVGSTAMPQYFAIGHHQCRWNYLTEEDVLEVSAKFDEHDMPMDVMWLDIEYAEEHKYFIWDESKFPTPEKMQEALVARGRQLVAIIDPHIKRTPSLHVYKEAQDLGILCKTPDGGEYEGWCWTGSSSWVDWFDPKSWDWWTGLFKFDKFKGSTRNLWVWNDMNEPSVFNAPEITMPRDNVHHGGWEHRDVHNMFGMLFHNVTSEALIQREAEPRRPFVLSRSFFAGSQRFGAIWTGDNGGSWDHLAVSVPMILANGVGGMAWNGADVGGFFGDPSPEMLVRWYQAGAFAPFFRAHAHIDTKRREPYLFDEPIRGHLRDALRLRYSLLPMWYTAFWDAHRSGKPIAMPHYIAFPGDKAGIAIDDQFYVGSKAALLVKPITKEGATDTSIYLVDEQPYYDYFTNEVYFGTTGGSTVSVPAPLDKIPVYQRGGSIVPRRDIVRRSAILAWRDPITLVAATDDHGSAQGNLYLDDGETYNFQQGDFVHRSFSLTTTSSKLVTLSNSDAIASASSVELQQYSGSKRSYFNQIKDHLVTDTIVVLGLAKKPSCVKTSESASGLAFDWQDGIGASAGRKRSGKTASRLTIQGANLRITQVWELLIHFDGQQCAQKSYTDPTLALQSPACPIGQYQCQNEGHKPACILFSRVNDGLCDSECCDGSDEFDGKVACPNKCKEVGQAHRKQMDEENRKTRVGAQVRSEYITFGRKEKLRLEANVDRLQAELIALEEKEHKMKTVLDQPEARGREETDRKKASLPYRRLVDHQQAIKMLRGQRDDYATRLDELVALLNDLRADYNPNYQDMAVKGAVKGFEDWQRANGYDLAEEGAETEELVEEAAATPDSMATSQAEVAYTDDQLKDFEKEDPLSILDDLAIGQVSQSSLPDVTETLFRLENYVPEALKPSYTAGIETLLSVLSRFGIIKDSQRFDASSSDRPDVVKARSLHSDAQKAVTASKKHLKEEKDSLAKDWGLEWEFKKLEGVCVDKNTGEYTYEICLFKEGKQKSNKGAQSTSLGRFASWHPTAEQSSDVYYTKQVYDKGQRCWNGPERSVKLDIICGTNNELLSVMEPNKCEYLFRMTSPAVCKVAVDEGNMKAEL